MAPELAVGQVQLVEILDLAQVQTGRRAPTSRGIIGNPRIGYSRPGGGYWSAT
jgi:hypothetical protein